MADLAKSTKAIADRLKAAQAAYNQAVSNQESSTIINKAKAALDEAQKAYDLSAPQRADIAAVKPVAATATPVVPGTGTAKATATATAVPADAEVFGEEVTLEEQPDDGAGNAPARYRSVTSRKPKYDPISGKLTGYDILYSDGTTEFEAGPNSPDQGPQTTYEAPDGTIFTDLGLYNAYVDKLKLDEKRQRGQSAYELLYEEFDKYGLASLVKDVEEFVKDGLSKAELTLKLRGTKTYQTRFAANADRIKNGYAAIDEATYVGLEDQYQRIMENYGLPESYYARSKDGFGTQEGFQKFIANDVSAIELEDRVMAGQERVLNSNPEVLAALKSFYPGITNGDILAYTLDPTNALTEIKRKVTAAEIGGAAMQAGLKTNLTRADELAQAGITKARAQEGFQTVAEVAPRGGQLAAMYGEDPYTQQTAEQEVFGLAGSVEASKQRRKLAGLEQASFSGQAGTAQGALGRERAGNF